jgi:hypothetical protein
MRRTLYAQSHSNHLSIFAIAVLALVLFAPSSSKAQVTWIVTVDFSSEQDIPVYTVSQSGSSACNYPTPADAYLLRICSGDIVVWKAATKSKKYSLKVLFRRAVLDDKNSNPALLFSGNDANPTQGGKTDSKITADDHEEYEYIVSVYDTMHSKHYLHDPKIIIGTGKNTSIKELVQILESNLEQLRNSLRNNTEADVQGDLEKLNKTVRDLRKHLNLQ